MDNKKEPQAWTSDDIMRILLNPAYCLNPNPLVAEELWIAAVARLIKEEGAETVLQKLLDILRPAYR